MTVHTIHIESTADENRIELRSAARWARALGCTLRFKADAARVHLEIQDRVMRFARDGSGVGRMVLEIQVATAEDRVTLLTEKSGEGVLVVRSASDVRSSEVRGSAPVQATLVLFLLTRDEAGHGRDGA